MNAFEVLGLMPCAWLSDSAVQDAYLSLAKVEDVDLAALNQARERLLTSDKRLRHYIDLVGPEEARLWQAVPIQPALMDCFLRLGQAKADALSLIERRQAAHSALARALLERPTLAVRERLEAVGFSIADLRHELEAQLPSLGEQWTALVNAQAQLAYMTKWQSQIRECLLQLM
jgi:hypothetical protein